MNLMKLFETWWNTERLATAYYSQKQVAEEAYIAGYAASGKDDLLQACEALLQINNEREPFTYAGMWEWKKRKYEAEQKARTAIAKARGET